MVAWSVSRLVCLLVCNNHEPCQKWLNQLRCRLVVDLGGPKEPCVRWGLNRFTREGNFEGKKGPGPDMCDSLYTQSDSSEGRTGMVQMPTQVFQMGFTLAPPVKYDWTVRVQRGYGLYWMTLMTTFQLLCVQLWVAVQLIAWRLIYEMTNFMLCLAVGPSDGLERAARQSSRSDIFWWLLLWSESAVKSKPTTDLKTFFPQSAGIHRALEALQLCAIQICYW